jgi:hypothetical protein
VRAVPGKCKYDIQLPREGQALIPVCKMLSNSMIDNFLPIHSILKKTKVDLCDLCLCIFRSHPIVRQRLSKHILGATNTYATTQELLETFNCRKVWLYEHSMMNI